MTFINQVLLQSFSPTSLRYLSNSVPRQLKTMKVNGPLESAVYYDTKIKQTSLEDTSFSEKFCCNHTRKTLIN